MKPIRLNKEVYTAAYQPLFVTINADMKQSLFLSPQFNRKIIELLAAVLNTGEYKLPVYCLMPTHLHFIVYKINEGPSILNRINYFKSRSSHYAKAHGIKSLWQKRFYDHIVRRSESLKKICEYILENPVRKNLVDLPEEYEFSGIDYSLMDI